MFETLDDSLKMIGIYVSLGFCLAILYNILRFFRLAFPKLVKIAAISDFLFAVIAGLFLFIYSVPYGSGFFRFYYVVSAAVGFAANMLTFGFVVPPVARFFGRVIAVVLKKLRQLSAIPLDFLCRKLTYLHLKIKKCMSEIAEKYETHLKNHRQMMYNRYNHKIGEVYSEGGENRNAIKAKVRKIV